MRLGLGLGGYVELFLFVIGSWAGERSTGKKQPKTAWNPELSQSSLESVEWQQWNHRKTELEGTRPVKILLHPCFSHSVGQRGELAVTKRPTVVAGFAEAAVDFAAAVGSWGFALAGPVDRSKAGLESDHRYLN